MHTRRQNSWGYLRIPHTIQTTLKFFKIFFTFYDRMLSAYLVQDKKVDQVFTSLFTEFSNINGLCGQMATQINFCAK